MPLDAELHERVQQRIFDIQSAAEYVRSIGGTGTTPHTIRGLIAAGSLPKIKIGKKFFVTRAALDSWISAHERRAK